MKIIKTLVQSTLVRVNHLKIVKLNSQTKHPLGMIYDSGRFIRTHFTYCMRITFNSVSFYFYRFIVTKTVYVSNFTSSNS